MRRNKVLNVAGVLMLFCAPLVVSSALAAQPPTASPTTTAQLSAMVGNFVAAWNSNDADTLVSLFAPDGRFLSPSGDDAHGREQIRELLVNEHRTMFRGTTLHATTKTVVLHPDKAAALSLGSYTLEGVDVALWVEVAVEGSFRFQFTRKAGQWLIATARISKS